MQGGPAYYQLLTINLGQKKQLYIEIALQAR